ncbi:o-succinylbenzoate synthase [Micrococcoides hystricis]|uniref:O-succinylbenzoate synthase n=1 Tax=Micrococcoides hystricis TaxID=1572761 RepID=A0ABV6PB22_9MICC
MTVNDLPLKDPDAVWPSLEELLAETHVVSIPLNTKFRGVRHREAAIFLGGNRPSEFSPFLEYHVPEAATWLAAALNYGYGPAVEQTRPTVPVNATVPAIQPEEIPELITRYGNPDQLHTVKVKVAERGENLATDIARVRTVRDLLPHAKVRIDANEGYSVAAALELLTEIANVELEYAEQPVAGIEDLARLREQLRARGIDTLIAADEAVRKSADPLRVAQLGAADLIVVKAQPLGGIRRARAIITEAGLPAVISSALDTGVGINMGAALAASLPELPFACGLATGALYVDDILTTASAESLYAVPGRLAPTEIAVDPEKLRQYAAAPEREQFWRERIRACFSQLLATGEN